MMRIPRLDWNQYWMLLAHLTATRSTCDRGPELLFDPGRHGVGAVLVRDKRCLAGGFNGSAPGQPHCDEAGHIFRDGHCVRTIHSEMNALLQCALDGSNPQGSTLYTTASPCYDCAKSIIRAGIVRVVFGQPYDSRYGLSDTVVSLLSESDVRIDQIVITKDMLERP
jgi:dCMP deaminase